MKYEVVDICDAAPSDRQVIVRTTDGAEVELPPGTELVFPDAANPETVLGTPIVDITGLTLDGRFWIPARVAEVEIIPGSVKLLHCELTEEVKRMPGAVLFNVVVTRVVAVMTG